MMKYVNKHTDSSLSVDDTAKFLKLLAPVIPFEADELYEKKEAALPYTQAIGQSTINQKSLKIQVSNRCK